MAHDERRTHGRQGVDLAAWLVVDGRRVRVRVHDVSAGGISVIDLREVDLGREIQIEILLPPEELPLQTEPVVLDARIIWCSRTMTGEFQIGCSYRRLNVAATEFVQRVVRYAERAATGS